MSQDELSDEMGKDLDALAAGWAARLDRGTLTTQERAALDEWLGADVRHRGALARAQAALAYFSPELDAAIAPVGEAPYALAQALPGHTPAPVSRRRLLWIGGGVAGAAAASVAVLAINAKPQAVIYSAERGEIRSLTLQDGTTVTLDTASSIAVRYLPGTRNVELLGGRALFDVAKDSARPFIVTAAGLRVRAVGTSFVVRNAPSHPPEVLVQEGVVDVGHPTGPAPIRVGANTRVIASANGGPALNVISVDPATISRELSWRQGMLAFEEVSLASIAEEFARYSDARIVIPDPKLAATTITGRFAANNPLGFARAAALSLGLTLDVKGHEIVLKRS